MIFDTLSNNSVYKDLGSKIAQGLAWLDSFLPSTPDGRYEIDGEEVYALVQSYETVPPAEKKFESHRNYLDIQYVASGSETIHYAPVTGLEIVHAYDEAKDFMLYSDPKASVPLHFEVGSFAIFFPQDGHKPGCVNGGLCRIKKVVIKVRV